MIYVKLYCVCVYIYIYWCGVIFRQSVRQPLLVALVVFGLPRSPLTTMPNTYGGSLKLSDQLGAGQFHRRRLNPRHA